MNCALGANSIIELAKLPTRVGLIAFFCSRRHEPEEDEARHRLPFVQAHYKHKAALRWSARFKHFRDHSGQSLSTQQTRHVCRHPYSPHRGGSSRFAPRLLVNAAPSGKPHIDGIKEGSPGSQVPIGKLSYREYQLPRCL